MMEKFVFAEPFLLFSVKKISEKALKRLLFLKAEQLLNTKDFFYVYRRWKDGFLCLVIKADQSWNETDNVIFCEHKYPLLLHLKDGKYTLQGKSCFYNVDLTSDAPVVKVSVSPLDGFKAVEEDDLIPEQFPLKYSLRKKEYASVFIAFSFICVLLLFLSCYLGISLHTLSKKATDLARRRKVLFVSDKKMLSPFSVVKKINEIADSLGETAYISQIRLGKKSVVFTLKCTEKDCFVPVKEAEKVDPFTYILKWRILK